MDADDCASAVAVAVTVARFCYFVGHLLDSPLGIDELKSSGNLHGTSVAQARRIKTLPKPLILKGIECLTFKRS